MFLESLWVVDQSELFEHRWTKRYPVEKIKTGTAKLLFVFLSVKMDILPMLTIYIFTCVNN